MPIAVKVTPCSATSSYMVSNHSCATCPDPAPMSARMTGAPSAKWSMKASRPAGVWMLTLRAVPLK